MVRLVTLSMNARSWLTNTTARALVVRNCSSHWIDSMSRWLVGSSSSNTSGRCSSNLANSMRMRQPPENSEVGRVKSERTKPKPTKVFSISASHPSADAILSISLRVVILSISW